jgi:acetyltransferase-like isoleucine patch superfamily enzyme
MIKSFLKKAILYSSPLLNAICALFFDRKYLRGKYFDSSVDGYIWCARAIWQRNILRLALPLPFPAALGVNVSNGRNLEFHPDDLNNFQSRGTYFQNFEGCIKLGRGCCIAPNVGIITSNHDPLDLSKHLPAKSVHLGERCWIGMNSVILPGVSLGPHTIVGAGSIVTKSFTSGHVIIAGNPAKIIRNTVGA